MDKRYYDIAKQRYANIEALLNQKFLKRIEFGQCLPPWHGFAWYEDFERIRVCLPMPLNVIARWVRDIYLAVRYGAARLPMSPREAYHMGYADGMKARSHDKE